MAQELVRISRNLTRALKPLRFKRPITHVYNPLVYARGPHEDYLLRFAHQGCEAVFVGMNPGPFGMAQTGVPFGDVKLVKEWIGVRGAVERPEKEHPKRPVLGFDCPRSEVSGSRLWGWARDRFGQPERFFARFFVLNYCPLVFMEASGKNRTPDKCARDEKDALFQVCDRALRRSVEWLEPGWVIGVGNFAETRAREALVGLDLKVGKVLHPSPQSPLANRGWAHAAEADLARCGIRVSGRQPDPRS